MSQTMKDVIAIRFCGNHQFLFITKEMIRPWGRVLLEALPAQGIQSSEGIVPLFRTSNPCSNYTVEDVVEKRKTMRRFGKRDQEGR